MECTGQLFTSKGLLPEASLELRVVWSDLETPLINEKLNLQAKLAAVETAMISGDGPAFYAAMTALKDACQAPLALAEAVCNIEHWLDGECVRRQVNIKKLVGESSKAARVVLG